MFKAVFHSMIFHGFYILSILCEEKSTFESFLGLNTDSAETGLNSSMVHIHIADSCMLL